MSHLKVKPEDRPAEGHLLSVTIPAPDLDVHTFLRHGYKQARMLWRDPNVTLAGFGTAAEIFGWGQTRFRSIEQQAAGLFEDALVDLKPNLFGGFSFTSKFIPDEAWSRFYPAHFILPHYQYLERNGERHLLMNVVVPEEESREGLKLELESVLKNRLHGFLTKPLHQMRPIEAQAIRYPMDESAWTGMLARAIDQMNTTDLNKVVLARVAEIELARPASIAQLLQYLDTYYPGCNRFLFEPRPHYAFYGATPETLVEVARGRVFAMGLAGSAPRGDTAGEDERHGRSLLDSPKNRHEHDLVVRSIERRLKPLTAELDVPDEPVLMKLSNIQHLYTPISGRLSDPAGVLPLLEILHPTPALGGDPRDLAMTFLASDEPITRGWYGAPVGYLSHNEEHHLDGAFGVAIRSAVAQREKVWAYAGAGIVADSIPEQEWEETAIKFRPMLNAVGYTDP